MKHYLKNLIQLILSPRRAWAEISEENVSPAKLSERGLYPLFAIVCITAFAHGLYWYDTFNVADQLQIALSQFLSLFLGVMIGRAVLEAGLPYVVKARINSDRAATLAIYVIGILSLIQIFANICPVTLTIIWFLPLFVSIILWQARDYLEIKKSSEIVYMIGAFLTLVIVPLLIGFILNLIL